MGDAPVILFKPESFHNLVPIRLVSIPRRDKDLRLVLYVRMMKAANDENNKRHALGAGRFGESGTRYG